MENLLTEKYLFFITGERSYAIHLKHIKEILRMVSMHSVSELPPFVTGVINLRGTMLPVVDFQVRAGLGKTMITAKTRIIVVKMENLLVGLLVDHVSEVIDVHPDMISRNIQPDVVLNSKYISGMVVLREQWITLIDIKSILTDQEQSWFKEQVNEQSAVE